MNEPLLHLGDAGAALWLEGELYQGPLADLASRLQGRPARVFVPSQHVFLARVEVPPGNRQKLLRAVPYTLEDHLAEDVERLHFAVGERDETGRLAVAVVARRDMDRWIAALNDAGILYRAMHPDLFLLPLEAGGWSVTTLEGIARVRSGPADGFAGDQDNLTELLRLRLREQGEPPARLDLWLCPDPIALGDLGAAIPVHTHRCPHLLALGADGTPLDGAIDLAQGDYSPSQRWSRLWRPWRLAAGLAAAWVIVHLGLLAWDNARLAREQAALRERIEAVYRQAFPDARKVVNPRVQMTRRLERLKQGGSQTGDFLALLGRVAPFLAADGVEIASVRYKQGTLDVEVRVPSLAALDRLKGRLEKEAQVVAEIQSAAAREGKVQGRLHIEARA